MMLPFFRKNGVDKGVVDDSAYFSNMHARRGYT
jgi:hypothetical protein